MSEQIAFLRKKGGGLAKVTEKVLWTNPSPSENFAAQDITLSDDIDNYDYVAIKYAYSTVLSTGMCIATILATSEDVKKWEYNAGVQHNLVTLAVQNAANTYYSRTITCKTNTSLRFGTCYQMATNTTSNSLCIPLQILGLNIATDDKYTDLELVSLGTSGATTATSVSVALNDDIDNYEYLVFAVNGDTDADLNYIRTQPTSTSSFMSCAIRTEYFKRNSIQSKYASGSSGSATYKTITYTYASDTTISVSKSNDSRSIDIYGIKATRKEKKPYTETSLWTNSDTSTSATFAGQTVNLSDNIRNYKYLCFKYCLSSGEAGRLITQKVIVSTEEFARTTATANNMQVGLTETGTTSGNNYFWTRAVYRASDTSVTFSAARTVYNTVEQNSRVYPLEILGLNELAHGKTNQTILWTNPSPTSQFAAQTIALDLSDYDAIILKCSSLNSNTLPSEYPTHACAQQYIPVPYGTAGQSSSRLSYGIVVEGSNSAEGNRETIVTTSGVTFGGGYKNYSAGNQYAIPIQIIGVKIS